MLIPVANICAYWMTFVPVSWCDAFSNAAGSFIMEAYVTSILAK
jgi:hypothetical protein